MDLLRSSILGKEFVNYRKSTIKESRVQFSHKVRSQGIGNIPVVVDSVEHELTRALSEKSTFSKNNSHKYGKELVFHMDKTVGDVLKEIKIILVERDFDYLWKEKDLVLGTEDGTILKPLQELGTLYKKHRNEHDKILYLMLSREHTVYGYIFSILKYLGEYLGESMMSFKKYFSYKQQSFHKI